MKYIGCILLAALVCAPALAANLYKWVDADGVVHYSDQPHKKGAKPVDLPGLSSFATPNSPQVTPRSNKKSKPTKPYDTLAITSPQPKETLHANDGKVEVVVAMKPRLRRGQRLTYKLDGKKAGTSQSTSITLTNVVRGTHTISVVAVNQQGDEVQQSKPVTFYVRHHSILNH